MIIKSSQRSGGKSLAKHLTSPVNERVTLIATFGVNSSDVAGAIAEMKMVAMGSCAKKYLYHVSASPEDGVEMTESDWERVWSLYDKEHGLHDLQYIEIEHEKNQRVHRHRVYNRVSLENLTAVNLSWTRLKNETVSRQLEVELGHSIIPGGNNRSVIKHLEKNGRLDIAEKLMQAGISDSHPSIVSYTHKEWQSMSRGSPLDSMREMLADAWRSSDSSKSFMAAVTAYGFTIAQGDKTPVAIDPDGLVVPVLRAINVALKKRGEKPIRKADLEARLERLSVFPIITPRSCIAKKNAKSEDSECRFENTLSPKPAIRHRWVRYRENLLYEQYKNLDATNLSVYWKVFRSENGGIRLSNKSGDIFDYGDSLATNSKNIKYAATTMIQLAQVKGWDCVRPRGCDEFKLAIYTEAIKHDVECLIDTDNDQQLWNQAKNEIGSPRRVSMGLRL